MLIVSTDRISAFDWILPTPIPDKGRVLTTISAFWFDLLASGPEPIAHHLLTTDVDAMGLPAKIDREPLRGRGDVCIVEYDDRGLAAQLKVHALDAECG